MTNAFWEVRILMSEDLAGAGTKLDGRRSLERTSIVCYLMIEDLGGEVTRLINFMEFDKDKTSIVCNLVIEDLWGVRIWRNEDLGGVRILEEWGSWRSEDLGGVNIFEEWRSWRSRCEIGGQEEFIKDKLALFAVWWLRILEETNDMIRWGTQ